jgi:hypothetical protein
MELTRDPWALSDLIGTPVRERTGRRLGHVYEASAHRDRDGVLVIDELMVGRAALLWRLRGAGSGARGIPWGAVVAMEGGEIVVSV